MESQKSSKERLYEALAHYLEQQTKEAKARGWRWSALIGVALFFGVANAIVVGAENWRGPSTENYAAVVRVDGPIATGQMASIGILGEVLDRAFSDAGARCVALVINSPGGMVTQSQLIHDAIKSLAAERSKKVIAVAEDFLASGGYMIAAAAERIHAPTT